MKDCAAERWEQGSEFHWIPVSSNGGVAKAPWEEAPGLYGSGRDALRALLSHGMSECGWHRIHIPSYFCQKVAGDILSTGIEVTVYPDRPDTPLSHHDSIKGKPGDVVLLVNSFGLRSKAYARVADRGDFEIIEDHSHDPWSSWARESDADWCLASLRKTLPIPDGGVLWSPRGKMLPTLAQVTPEHQSASFEKLAAMKLKSLYLSGGSATKEDFRRLAVSGECHIAAGPVSGMSVWTENLLQSFPVESWRMRRRSNHKTLCDALQDIFWVQALAPDSYAADTPFSCVLVFDTSARRAFVQERLAESHVYAAILWPLDEPVVDGIPNDSIDLSRRMLSVHCDMRYDERDMFRVAAMISDFGEGYR